MTSVLFYLVPGKQKKQSRKQNLEGSQLWYQVEKNTSNEVKPPSMKRFLVTKVAP